MAIKYLCDIINLNQNIINMLGIIKNMDFKTKQFNQICSDIKSLKIQGASQVAKYALKAYFLKPSPESKKKIISLRPTEPALFNALSLSNHYSEKEIISHFSNAQDKISILVYNMIKTKKPKLIFTHCHSNAVVNSLIYSKNKGARFQVYSTETRPLYQGRLTAKQLSKAGVSVTEIVDSGMHFAVKKCDIVLLGADAILNKGVINKIGSASIAEIAKLHKKPVYIISDSWKFYPKNVKIEQRSPDEVWKINSKNIKIQNPAFELIPQRYVSKIISELGVLSHSDFVKKSKGLALSAPC